MGYFGMRNTGDSAFCVVLDHALRRYWGAEAPLFASPPVPELDPATCVIHDRWFAAERTPLRAGRVLGKLGALRRASMLLFGGGSVFRDMGPLSEKRAFAWWSRITGKPLAAVGVSIGPFVSADAERRLGRVLRRLEYLAVRDAASYERARALGYDGRLVLAADLAGLLPEAVDLTALRGSDDGTAPRRAPRLGVTLVGHDRALDAEARRRREEAIAEAVLSVARDGVDVTVLIFNEHPERGDVAVSRRLAAALADPARHRVVPAAAGVIGILAALAECDACLHVRLHGAVFSYLLGIPFALVPYQPKCDDFLAEIGQPDALRLPRVPASSGQVLAVLHRLLAGPAHPALPREAYTERARRNFTGAPWRLEGGAAPW